MKKSILFVFVLMVSFLSPDCCAEDGKGQVEIATDIEDALIYVNGKKKASAGEGYTMIRLLEGDYKIKVTKRSDDGQWIYKGTKNIFVGKDTSIKITIKTKRCSADKHILMVPEQETQPIEAKNSAPAPEKIVQEIDDNLLVEKAIPGLKLVLIKPGKFMMGSPPDESFRDDDCPVENVSWEDVKRFIIKLNQMLKTDKYRLPAESEWEYACRAGSATTFFYGQCLTSHQANFDNTNPMTGCPKGSYEGQTVPVAGFAPNALGLYDMHGNVWEWCRDLKETYPSGSKRDSSVTFPSMAKR